MGKFKNAMRVTGQVLDAVADREFKVRKMTETLMNKTYGLEYEQAKKVARVLIDQADITWK